LHIRVWSVYKRSAKHQLKIARRAKNVSSCRFLEKKIESARDEPRWMCMRLGERIRQAQSTFVISLSRLSLTLYCSEHTDAPFLLFVHLRAYQTVCTNSRAQVKARVEQNMNIRRASTIGCAGISYILFIFAFLH
jgi:hypothetical protein